MNPAGGVKNGGAAGEWCTGRRGWCITFVLFLIRGELSIVAICVCRAHFAKIAKTRSDKAAALADHAFRRAAGGRFAFSRFPWSQGGPRSLHLSVTPQDFSGETCLA